MRKIAFSLIVLSTLLITSCDLFSISCFSFKEETQSWGKVYSWASKTPQGEIIFYNYLKSDSPLYGSSMFYIKGPIDLETMKHKYGQEYENPTVGNIEKMNGQIKSITINNKKYVNSDLSIVY